MTRPSFIDENRPLASLTTFGIGGPARFFSEPSEEDGIEATYEFARAAGLPVLVLGGGSNLLIADAGVDAVVMRLRSEAFSSCEPDAAEPLRWRIGAAAALPGVVEKTAAAGISGLEALAGIPGRIGGAAAMNAGGADSGIGGLIASAEGFDSDGGRITLDGANLAFRYRGSALLGKCVTRLAFRFSAREEPGTVLERMRAFRQKKLASQPLGFSSAGCVFKNPPGESAGALLDRAGCKGMREGGAEVSGRHANFIVNSGGAGSGDVARLAARMREKVLAACGIRLEPEVRIWGNDPAFTDLTVPKKGGK